MTASLELRQWTEAEFAASRAKWQDLLASSLADPLFMSWDWQWRWWQHHHRLLDATLVLIGLYRQNGTLVGIAPLYFCRVHHRGWIRTSRLQLIGSAWRDGRPAFSEYLDVIAVKSARDDVIDALYRWLTTVAVWDEAVFAHALPDSIAACLARQAQAAASVLVREVDPMIAHRIPLPPRFQDYVMRLSSGTRRRVFNHRQKAGQLQLVIAGSQDIERNLDTLRRLKMKRWRVGAHDRSFLDFHREFAMAMAEQGCLQLTRLTLDGETISVLYNIRIGALEYYLESGFDEQRAVGISPGYLHLGHAIERACAAGVRHFDLLGGTGHHRAYKRDLCTKETVLSCYQIIRAPLLRVLYRVHAVIGQLKFRMRTD